MPCVAQGAPCSVLYLRCIGVTDFRSGALKRLMMLDLQRIEDEKLLQLPRLNPVAMILDVLSDRELPQVRHHFN